MNTNIAARAFACVIAVSFVVRFMIAQTVIEKGSDYGKHFKQQQQDGAHSSELRGKMD